MNRLLLVEDDPTSRSFLQAASAALPAEVDIADSVEAAYALATVNAYDAWLIDANLPDGTGGALLARLRADGRTTPAIAHTAARERRELDALRAEGFDIAVSKPVAADVWRGAIRRVLVRRSGARPAPLMPLPDARRSGEAPLWNGETALAAVGGDSRNVRGLRELFVGELDGTRARIAAASTAGDGTAVRGDLHRLRAGCGFVGAERLGLAARVLHVDPTSASALKAFLDTLDATRTSANALANA
ncbi:response regulator [Luteimonas fraxinea]|uniref:Response regulator n=1 Tax=Luteimonas fraxinea TaxID=2901869 RepID=A0ABS8UBT8_9GAMM|nr:response regulator [Luteimonas fraxinea]MCD9096335.1 response regulator [Luteimonas fraxinea]MCD9125678.1 response regulator [Luteimonas fraxinea]UHH10288.1 response regulator [Luteimonas fraxinea]